MKTYVSNLVPRHISEITFHHYNQMTGKSDNLKTSGASKPKDLNRIAKIGYGHKIK